MSLHYSYYISNFDFKLIEKETPFRRRNQRSDEQASRFRRGRNRNEKGHHTVAGVIDSTTDPLDFSVDRAVTATRIKSFLAYKFLITKPREGKPTIVAGTVKQSGPVFCEVVIYQLLSEGKEVSVISKILGGRMKAGLYFAPESSHSWRRHGLQPCVFVFCSTVIHIVLI